MKPARPAPACAQRRGFAKAAAFLLLACSAPQAEEAVRSLSVQPARDYGIVLGEVLRSEIRVAVAKGFSLETAALPQAGSAVDDVLELRELAWDRQDQAEATVYTLRLAYQVFKGVRTAESVEVPALPLRFGRGAEVAEAQAPAWRFTLNPLIPAQTPDEAVAVRPGLPPPPLVPDKHAAWLLACLAGLGGLGVWQARALGLPPFHRHAPPFARALVGLRRLGRRQALDGGAWRQALRLVHRALDETAGRVVTGGQLERFLLEQPQFAGLRAELRQFFAVSEALFFADRSLPPEDYAWGRLEALCRQLASAGRRG